MIFNIRIFLILRIKPLLLLRYIITSRAFLAILLRFLLFQPCILVWALALWFFNWVILIWALLSGLHRFNFSLFPQPKLVCLRLIVSTCNCEPLLRAIPCKPISKTSILFWWQLQWLELLITTFDVSKGSELVELDLIRVLSLEKFGYFYDDQFWLDVFRAAGFLILPLFLQS